MSTSRRQQQYQPPEAYNIRVESYIPGDSLPLREVDDLRLSSDSLRASDDPLQYTDTGGSLTGRTHRSSAIPGAEELNLEGDVTCTARTLLNSQ